MRILIDIPDQLYKDIKNGIWCGNNIISNAIEIGTPILDNATVGEVFCMLACKEPICETASYFTIDKKLWNSPYQKGGKNEQTF